MPARRRWRAGIRVVRRWPPQDVCVEEVSHRSVWFARRETGIGFGPVVWQGRAVLAGWALLVVVALITYSTLSITFFVVVFYTAIAAGIMIVKSDLRDEFGSSRDR